MRVVFFSFWNFALDLSMIRHRFNDRGEHWKYIEWGLNPA